MPSQPTLLAPSAVLPVSIPARAAENLAALSCNRAGSLPYPMTRGARARHGHHEAAMLHAERLVGMVLVPCWRLRRTARKRRCCGRARRGFDAVLCRRPQHALIEQILQFAREFE